MKFVVAAMNGGKTTLLLQTVHSWRSRDFNVILIKPSDDTRNNAITSRIGASAEVDIRLSRTDDLTEKIDSFIEENVEDNHVMIVVDEAQFLTVRQVEDLFLYSLRKPVVCYGLKTDFRGNAFPGAARLLELSEIEEIHLIRCRCGNEARFNARFDKETGKIISEGPKKLIEGSTENIIYDPVCDKCFVDLGGFTRKTE